MNTPPVSRSAAAAPVPGGARSPAPDAPSRFAADGSERPGFLLDFPEDPELNALVSAFERGDFAEVRVRAPKLVATTESAAVRAAALELKKRITPDPMVVWFLAGSLGLLIFLVTWSYWQH